MILYGTLIDKLISRFKNADKKNGEVRALFGSYINQSVKEVYRAHNWAYRKKTSALTLIPNYETGTATVTKFNGSNESTARAVTISSDATLTANMQGRYFRVKDSSYWHKITNVNTSTRVLTLDAPIVDKDTGSYEYEIWKRFYYVRSEVDVILGFGDWGGRTGMDYDPSSKFESRTASIGDEGQPFEFADYGVDPIESSYSTGTIQISEDDNIVTGSATVWLGNVDAGDVLTVNNKVFTVKRVETDTRIVLYNYVSEGVPANTDYKIEKDNPLGFQFYYNADDYKVIPYTYLALAPNMVHETKDVFPLPDAFEDCVLTRAEWMRMKDNDDQKWIATVEIYQGLLNGLKAKRDVVRSAFSQFSPKVHTSMPGRY